MRFSAVMTGFYPNRKKCLIFYERFAVLNVAKYNFLYQILAMGSSNVKYILNKFLRILCRVIHNYSVNRRIHSSNPTSLPFWLKL